MNEGISVGKTNTARLGLRYDYDNNVRSSMGRIGSGNTNYNTSKTIANEYGYRTRQGDNINKPLLIVNSLTDISNEPQQ